MKTPASLKNKVAIVGVGESDIGKVPHMTGLGLNAQAAKRALDDAGLEGVRYRRPADRVFVHRAVLHAGLGDVRVPRAQAAVQRVADRRRREPRGHAQARRRSDRRRPGRHHPGVRRREPRDRADRATPRSRRCWRSDTRTSSSRTAARFPGFYAMIAQRHMHEYGTTREQLAQVAVNTREHALLHPNAHMKTPLTHGGRALLKTDRRSARHARLLPDLGRRRRLHRHLGRARARPQARSRSTCRASASTTRTST